MKIVTDTVTNGRIVVEGQFFAEGEKVMISSHDDRESFAVSAEEKRLLLESIAQADRRLGRSVTRHAGGGRIVLRRHRSSGKNCDAPFD